MANWLIWLPLLAPAVAAVAAKFTDWDPWQIVALVAVLAPAAAVVTCALAWYLIRARALDEAPLSDEQLARALGAALGNANPWLDASVSAEVWAAHASLPPERRREMAEAVLGLTRSRAGYDFLNLRANVLATVRGFVPHTVPTVPTGPTPLPAELLGSAYGGLVATITGAGAETVPAVLSAAYAELPDDWRGALVHALSGFVGDNPADEIDDWEPKVIDGIAAFRAAAPRAPAPTHALAALFGVALGRSGASASVEPVRVLWGAFADAPPDLRPAFNSALTCLSAAGEPDDPDAQLLAVATTFRAPAPEPASAV